MTGRKESAVKEAEMGMEKLRACNVETGAQYTGRCLMLTEKDTSI